MSDVKGMSYAEFYEQTLKIEEEVCGQNGKTAGSHKYPAWLEVWDGDNHFDVISLEPTTHMGCGCWNGLRIHLRKRD